MPNLLDAFHSLGEHIKPGLSKFLQGLQNAAPYLDEIGAHLANAGGNPTLLQNLNARRALDQRQQMINSDLEDRALQRRHLQQEVDAFETPEQADARALNRQRALLTAQREMAAPELFSEPSADGKTLNWYQRKFDSGSGGYIISPAEMQSQEIIFPVHRLQPFPTGLMQPF